MMNIALVAHDEMKDTMIGFCIAYENILKKYGLYATGTTGKLISSIDTGCEIDPNNNTIVHIICPLAHTVCLLSGPLGGDQQIGAMIATGAIDVLIFFCDNLVTQGHQQDVSALVRLASLYNIPFATNRTTADMLITSPLLLDEDYKRIIPAAINNYKNRII
jgi:methylglyoxal synthase